MMLGSITRAWRNLLVLGALLGTPQQAVSAAQSSDSTPTERREPRAPASQSARPVRQFGAWFAVSLDSKVSTRTGDTFRDFYLIGLRYTKEIQVDHGLAADYFFDLLPFAISTHMPDYTIETVQCPRPCPMTRIYRETWHDVFAFGAAPFGLQFRVASLRDVQPFLNVSGGFLWFQRPVPDPDATQFNFTAQFGAGVQIRASDRYRLLLGYQFHHTSNASLGDVNPGMNSWMVVLGLVQHR